MTSYVNSIDVLAYLDKGISVRSAIAGCIGTVLLVDENKMIFITTKRLSKIPKDKFDKIKLTTGIFNLEHKDNVIAINNDDGSITLWNEGLVPKKPQPITDNDLKKFLTWEDGYHLVKVMPNRDEVSAMTIGAFIYFYDILKSEHTRYVNLAQLHLNQLNMDVVFELLQRIDKGEFRLKETFSISNDFISHYETWLGLFDRNIKDCDQAGEEDNKIFWQHERNVFERSMAHLFSQNFPEIEVPKT